VKLPANVYTCRMWSDNYKPLLLQCHAWPVRPPVRPLNRTSLIPLPVRSVTLTLTRTDSSHSEFQNSCQLSIARYFQKTSSNRRPRFSPSARSQAGGPPLVACAQLPIEYIRSYRLYLQTASRIRKLSGRHAVVIATRFLMQIKFISVLNKYVNKT
jgi:hypothetical protein